MGDFTYFGGDIPLDQLPEAFQDCIIKSKGLSSTTDCDILVGSYDSRLGYCSQDEFKQMTYCGCVNAPVGNPACFYKYCSRGQGYIPTQQAEIIKAKKCPNIVNCWQIVRAGGSGNIISGVKQQQNCGVEKVFWNIKDKPILLALIVLVFLLLVILAFMISSRRARERRARRPNGGKSAVHTFKLVE